MKTVFALIIAVFFANVASASGSGLKVNLASSEQGSALMEISTFGNSSFEIDIRDAYGEKLYSMKTEAPRSEFKKRYDFSKLEDGTYWYTVKIDKEKVTKTFVVEDGKVEVQKIRKTAEPFFLNEDGLLKISFLNHGQENVEVILYDMNRNVLAQAELGNNLSIQKAIDISELRWGDYEVVLVNDEDIYDHEFSIR